MAADLRAHLQAGLAGTYTIEQELGGGGMAQVFVAVETALARRVVIKVLSPDLAAGVSTHRFSREIRLAAALQHANIVPVLSAGEVDGLPYYTMPFIEGLSLRARLEREGGIPFPQAVSVLRDLARALGYAHDHGVVHRDIKPDNILLSGDAAVVTDFGIAKALSAARVGEEVKRERTTTVTQSGTALGTPAYMAPEQIAADPAADHRADLYAFGCVAYELFATTPPFTGRSTQQVMAAHLHEPPVPLGEKRPDCSPAIVRLVMQCLEKDPAARPQSAREILGALEVVPETASWLSRFRHRRSRRQRIALLSVVGIIAAGALLAMGRSWFRTPGEPAVETVAVVPFVSGDSTLEYVAEGMADELATSLGRIPGVRVIARTLSARYRSRPALDAREIGRELATNYVLHGRVRRLGGRVNVSAQLISATDNTETWSETFTRDERDVIGVQDSITRAVGLSLQRRAGGSALAAGIPAAAVIGTRDPAAYDLYLRGRLLLERRGAGVAQAVERFEAAITRDSNFARAHAGLGVALELLPYFSEVRAVDVRTRAMRAAERALALDSMQAEAYTALGLANQHAYEWAKANQAYQRAIAIDPDNASARVQYGRLLVYTGRLADSKREFDRARALDPSSAVASAWAGHLLSLMGRTEEGLVQIERALEIDSLNPPALFMATQAHLDEGRPDSAKVFAERLLRRVPSWRVAAAIMHGLLGERELPRLVLRELQTGPPRGDRDTQIAMLAAGLGDTALAFTSFEHATAVGDAWPTWVSLSERMFDPMRSSTRFAAIVRRVGLDERVFTSPGGGRPR